MSENQKPVETLSDGALQVSIWKNESENGSFYSTKIVRRYKDGEDWKDANSFSGSDILKVVNLMQKAYDVIGELRKADKAAA